MRNMPRNELRHVSQHGPSLQVEQGGGRIAASGGLIRHHEQYDELLGVDPDNAVAGSTRSAGFKSAKFSCTACHDPHTTTVYQGISGDPVGAKSTNADCLACHPTKDPAASQHPLMGGLNCIDCHMPRLVKSAVSADVGNGVINGDIRSHIFRIDVTATAQINPGGFAYPALTAEFACHSCHNGTDAHNRAGTDESTFTFH